jgi:sortase A
VTTDTAPEEAEAAPSPEFEAEPESAPEGRGPRRLGPVRRTFDITGRILIALGVVVLLFTAYQIWGTSLQEEHTQSQLRTTLIGETNQQEIRHALAEAAALDKLPTGPPVTAPTVAAPPEGDPVGQISIPIIGVNQIVVEGTNTPDLRKGPGHYIGTPLPGEAGNVAVAGHRTTYGHPFYNLDSVAPGDPIVLTTLQGVFVYDAFRSLVISPSNTSVLQNTPANMLTLTTCNPRFSASTRLIVEAKLVHSQLFPNSGLPAAVAKERRAEPPADNASSGVDLTDALAWGALALGLVGLTIYLGYRYRRRRWVTWIVGCAGILVVLYLFFGAVSPLLPASF